MGVGGSFLDHLADRGVHPWISDIAARCISRGEIIDPAVLSKMEDAFDSFLPGPTLRSVCMLIRSQGYGSGIEGDYISVEVDEKTVRVFLEVSEDTGPEDIVLRKGNVSCEDGVRLYPLFAAGMFFCFGGDEIRQKRTEYHWPDRTIPGR